MLLKVRLVRKEVDAMKKHLTDPILAVLKASAHPKRIGCFRQCMQVHLQWVKAILKIQLKLRAIQSGQENEKMQY